MSYLGIFGPEFWKTSVILEISTLEFVENESLTHTANFDIGSAFSERPSPVPIPLYKACRNKESKKVK